MTILALDTATEVLSVALRIESSRRAGSGASRFNVLSATRDIGLMHSQVLMPLIDQLLSEAGATAGDLDLIACTRGPGSFTGLRIGMSTAKGLAAAVASLRSLPEPPVVSVPTLDVMASAVPPAEGTAVVPVIDGRKGRFYAAVFSGGRRLTDDLDRAAGDTLDAIRSVTDSPVVLTGPHAQVFRDATGSTEPFTIDPDHRRGWAGRLLDLAEETFTRDGPDPRDLGPRYVRGTDAEVSRGT